MQNATVDVAMLLGLTDERPWIALAACRDADALAFFPGPDGNATIALKICESCPVTEDCLDSALEARERYGVWGGTTERDRRRLLRRAG